MGVFADTGAGVDAEADPVEDGSVEIKKASMGRVDIANKAVGANFDARDGLVGSGQKMGVSADQRLGLPRNCSPDKRPMEKTFVEG